MLESWFILNLKFSRPEVSVDPPRKRVLESKYIIFSIQRRPNIVIVLSKHPNDRHGYLDGVRNGKLEGEKRVLAVTTVVNTGPGTAVL